MKKDNNIITKIEFKKTSTLNKKWIRVMHSNESSNVK
jgi:hypothetical protein